MFAYVVVPSEAPTRCQANNRLSYSVTIEFKVNNYFFLSVICLKNWRTFWKIKG